MGEKLTSMRLDVAGNNQTFKVPLLKLVAFERHPRANMNKQAKGS